jgi:putative ABC transport system permease protein
MRSAKSERSPVSARKGSEPSGSRTGSGLRGSTARRFDSMRELAADCRFAFRSCRRDWRLASLVCLMMAFGIGSAGAVFSMVDQLLLQPPPGVNAGGSVGYLQFSTPGQARGTMGEGISTASFDQLREAATSLSGMASYGDLQAATSVGVDHPIEAAGNTIYGDFFEILGVRPSAGRLLYDRDTKLSEDPHRIVISESLRHRLFGPAPAVGRSLYLNGVAFTVLGVTAGGFAGTDRGHVADFWIPYGALTALYGFGIADLVSPVTRLHRTILVRARRGVRMSQAAAQITGIVHVLGRTPNVGVPYLATLRPTLFPGLASPPIIRGHTQRTMSLLTVIAVLVFLIVCANVSSLLLVRILKRRTTTATLLAIGASRTRVARQYMAHSVLLGLAGAVASIPVTWAICNLLEGGAFVLTPVLSGLHVDRALMLFVPLAGVLAGGLCGVVPTVLGSRLNVASALREGGVANSGQRKPIRLVFSTAQLAMSLMLAVGALLLLQTIHNLYSVETGMDTEGVLALSLHHSPRLSPAESHALYRRVVSAVSALPNVEGSALDPYGLPDGILAGIGLVGVPIARQMKAQMIPVTPGVLRILRIPVVNGRSFRDADWGFDKAGGVVLTASLARKLFGRTDVAGRQVALSPSKHETVLGVVGDIRSPDNHTPNDAFFVTYGDIGRLRLQYFTLLVRSRHSDPQTAQHIRAAVQDALPSEAVPEVRLLAADLSRITSEPLLLARLLSLLALFGFAVAAAGLYGVTATTVEDRRRELAIRLALGAKQIEIGRMVAAQSGAIVSVGTLAGLCGAYALGRALRSELFDVGPLDAPSYITAAALLVAVMTVATLGPTRHAMSIDPMQALREG